MLQKNNEAGKPDYISYHDSGAYTIDAENGSLDFILGSDIDLDNATIKLINGNYNLNLNGKVLDCSNFNGIKADIVISGDGTITGKSYYEEANVRIMNGTFKQYISGWMSKLIIEDATVYSGEFGYALRPLGDTTFEINGGTFSVSEDGLTGYNKETCAAVAIDHTGAKIVIKGGKFSGGKYGLYATHGDANNISLQGGIFEGTEAAINILGFGLNDYVNDKILETLLGEGYMYSTMTIVNKPQGNNYNYDSYTLEKSVEVVKKPEEPAQEETTSEDTPKLRNPKTSDNVINYALLFSISLLSFVLFKKIR